MFSPKLTPIFELLLKGRFDDSHKSIVSFVPILTEKAERNINGKVAM